MSAMLGIYTAPPSQGGTLLMDATPFAEGVTASTNVHGFEALPARVPGPLAEAFGLYARGTLYAAVMRDGSILWEGRLEDPAVYAGQNGSGLTMQALGAWRTLTDDRYTALWSSTSYSEWGVLTADDVAGFTSEKFNLDINNRLYIAPKKGANYVLNNVGVLGCRIPDSSTRQIAGIQFAYNLTANNQLRLLVQTRDSAWGSASTQFQLTGNGAAQTGVINIQVTANSALTFGLVALGALAYGAEDGAEFVKITHLRVVTTLTNRVNTTLGTIIAAGTRTVTPASMTGIYVGQELYISQNTAVGEIVTPTAITSTTFTAVFAFAHVAADTVRAHIVYGDEIAKDIVSQVSTLNSTQLSSSTALIQSPGVDLTDEVYEDAVPTDILTHLTELGDSQTTPRQWEVGVWEGRMLHFRPRGSVARAWYVDVTDLGIARTLEDLSNSVYATYKDANGRALRTANSTDSTSIARYGLTRRSNIAADTTSNTQATVQVSAQLADRKDPLPRATVGFSAIYDAGGARWPLWMVRSGDTVTIRNLPPSISTSIDRIRTFRISHTLYNLTTRALAIELEVPPPRLATLLARRAEGIKR